MRNFVFPFCFPLFLYDGGDCNDEKSSEKMGALACDAGDSQLPFFL